MDEIIELADRLAGKIADSDMYREVTEASQAFDADPKAKELLDSYAKLAQATHMKEQDGKPIEPDEKRQLKELQDAVSMHRVCLRYIQAQDAFSTLMMAVNQRISNALAGEPPSASSASPESKPAGDAPGASRIIIP